MSPYCTRLVLVMIILVSQESLQGVIKAAKESMTKTSGENSKPPAKARSRVKEHVSKPDSDRTLPTQRISGAERKTFNKNHKMSGRLKTLTPRPSVGTKRKDVFPSSAPKRSGRIGNYLVSPMDKAQLDLIHNIYNSFPLKSPGEDQERLNTEQPSWYPTTAMHSSQNYHHTGFQTHHVAPTVDVYTESPQAYPYASTNQNEAEVNEESENHPATTYTPAQYEDMLQTMHPKQLRRPTEHLHAVNQGKIHNLLFNIAYGKNQKPITKPMKLTPAEWTEFSNILHSYMSKSYNPAAIFDRPMQPSQPESPAPSLFTGNQNEETNFQDSDEQTSRDVKPIHLYGEPSPQLLSKLRANPTSAGKRKLTKTTPEPKKEKTST